MKNNKQLQTSSKDDFQENILRKRVNAFFKQIFFGKKCNENGY